MHATPDAARETWPCPLARTFAEPKHTNPMCRGDVCPLWRWTPLDARDPAFMGAIRDRMKEAKENHPTAVKWVMENREALGLPTKPTDGYCGLGGKP